MSLKAYLNDVRVNGQPIREWEIVEGKLRFDAALEPGDSILLISLDDSQWPSRKIVFGADVRPGLYLHAEMFKPSEPVPVLPPSPERAEPRSELIEKIRALELAPEVESAILEIEAEIRGAYQDTISALMKEIDALQPAKKHWEAHTEEQRLHTQQVKAAQEALNRATARLLTAVEDPQLRQEIYFLKSEAEMADYYRRKLDRIRETL